MRWTVEADTARDVIDWPEEVDDFQAALQVDPRVRGRERVALHADLTMLARLGPRAH